MNINRLYYLVKPFLPRTVQIALRRRVISIKRSRYADIWPIYEKAATPPKGWTGWPHQKQFAVVLTHDVEFAKGQIRCRKLMELEAEIGFKSSFNFVPERYEVSRELREHLTCHGFEVGVHGLNHDGKLYQSRQIFSDRASRINQYIKEWKAVGFRSPAMHHNLEWIHDLDIEYDLSTFDTDPFEPQSDGVGTIFPFWVNGNNGQKGYAELPYTLPQDFTVFALMKEKSIDIWKKKLDWVARNGGMVLVNTHPDYMSFDRRQPGLEEYPVEFYTEFLNYIKFEYQGQYWSALPSEIARFIAKKKRVKNRTVREQNSSHPQS